jgi:hypothetical protein
LINVGEIITDPDLVQSFTVYRSSGQFVKGRWVEDAPEQITMYGVVSVMSQRELSFMPESDRVKAAMVFHSRVPIYVTRAADGSNSGGTSDKIMWRGDYYKISSVSPYSDYGYYKAVGERIKGN